MVLYSRQTCFYCVRAKTLLTDLGVAFKEISVGRDANALAEMCARSKQRTVPQIWIGDHHVGGCDQLFDLHRSGKLTPLLQADKLNNVD